MIEPKKVIVVSTDYSTEFNKNRILTCEADLTLLLKDIDYEGTWIVSLLCMTFQKKILVNWFYKLNCNNFFDQNNNLIPLSVGLLTGKDRTFLLGPTESTHSDYFSYKSILNYTASTLTFTLEEIKKYSARESNPFKLKFLLEIY